MSVTFSLILAIALAAALALTAHVMIMKWTEPRLQKLSEDFRPDQSGGYSRFITGAAYLTALFPTSMIAVIYYYAGHLLPDDIHLRGGIVAALILESKGYLIREPVMSYLYSREQGHKAPFRQLLLQFADKWAANIALTAVIVLLCPVRG